MDALDSPLIAIARSQANTAGLDASLVCGIIERESSWNPWALRYEPAFFAKYETPLSATLSLTEARARAFSWGLMQTMGQSVREIGYKGDFPQLCDPATGIEWGCKLLQLKFQHAAGNVEQALQLWNGGSNPSYSADVLALAQKY